MRKVFVVEATVVILLLLVAPSMAASGGQGKGNGGGNSTTAVSSIELATPGDARTAAPSLGREVAFNTVAAGLAGWEWPMVAVWCYQDLDSDGMEFWPAPDDLVYMQLDHPDTQFVLGGGSSKWKTLGGAAECEADLYGYGNRGGKQTIRELAETYFSAAG